MHFIRGPACPCCALGLPTQSFPSERRRNSRHNRRMADEQAQPDTPSAEPRSQKFVVAAPARRSSAYYGHCPRRVALTSTASADFSCASWPRHRAESGRSIALADLDGDCTTSACPRRAPRDNLTLLLHPWLAEKTTRDPQLAVHADHCRGCPPETARLIRKHRITGARKLSKGRRTW